MNVNGFRFRLLVVLKWLFLIV